MPFRVVAPGASASAAGTTGELAVAFVNMMPDTAFIRTEHQFLDLLKHGAGELSLTVRLYAPGGVARGPVMLQEIATRYLSTGDLVGGTPPDAIVVTGAEPTAMELVAEPFYPELLATLRFAVQYVPSVLLSCLSAHAALFAFDGIQRVPLTEKRSGVFVETVSQSATITELVSSPLVMPHSRWNDVSPSAVREAGYEVLLAGEESGWSVVVGRRGVSEFVLVQGHPEYEPSSLLREYRRDLERFLAGARSAPPPLPLGCCPPEHESLLADFHASIVGSTDADSVTAELAFDKLVAQAPWPWRAAATALYEGWLRTVARGAASTLGSAGIARD